MSVELLLDERHCKFDGVDKCRLCGLPCHGNLLRNCEKGVKNPNPVVPRQRYCQRTEEEYRDVSLICYTCEHYQSAPGTCALLVRTGCGACRDGASFVKFKKSGKPCPDNRFPATETIREAATSKTWPSSGGN